MRKWLSFGRGCGLSAIQQLYLIEEAEHPENRKGSVFNAPVCAINRERTMLAVARAEDFRGDAVILVYEVDEGCYYGGDVHTFRVPAGHFRLIPATRFTAGAKVPVGKYSVWQALTWLRGGPAEFGVEPSVERLCRYADLSEPFSQKKFCGLYGTTSKKPDAGDEGLSFWSIKSFMIKADGIDEVDVAKFGEYSYQFRAFSEHGRFYPVHLTVHDKVCYSVSGYNYDKVFGAAHFVVSPFETVTVNDMIEALRLVYARHVGAKRVNEDMQALESALRSVRPWDTDSCDIEAVEDCCTRNKLRPATANGVFGESEKFRMEKELVIAERERDDNISRYECIKSELWEKGISTDFGKRMSALRILYTVKFCGLAGKNGMFTSKELDDIKLMEYWYADVLDKYSRTVSKAEEVYASYAERREEEFIRAEEERRRAEEERRRAEEERRRAEEERRRAEEAERLRLEEIDEKIDELCNGLGELNGSPHVKYVRHLRGLIKEYRNHSSYKRDWPDRSWIKIEDFEKYCKIVELEERIRALLCEREDRVKKPSRDSINEEWLNGEMERLVGLGGSPDLFDASEFEYACGDVLWAAAKGSQDNGQVCCSDKMTAWLATKKSEIDALRPSYADLLERETWRNNSFDKWYDKQVGCFYDNILPVYGESDYFQQVSNAEIRRMLETKFYDGSYESDLMQKYVWDLFLELWYEERIRRYYSGYPYEQQEERDAASAYRESFNGFMEDAELLSEMEHYLYFGYYDDKDEDFKFKDEDFWWGKGEEILNSAKFLDTAEAYAAETRIIQFNKFKEEVEVYGSPSSRGAFFEMMVDGFDYKLWGRDSEDPYVKYYRWLAKRRINYGSVLVYADTSDLYATESERYLYGEDHYGEWYESIGCLYGIERAKEELEKTEAYYNKLCSMWPSEVKVISDYLDKQKDCKDKDNYDYDYDYYLKSDYELKLDGDLRLKWLDKYWSRTSYYDRIHLLNEEEAFYNIRYKHLCALCPRTGNIFLRYYELKDKRESGTYKYNAKEYYEEKRLREFIAKYVKTDEVYAELQGYKDKIAAIKNEKARLGHFSDCLIYRDEDEWEFFLHKIYCKDENDNADLNDFRYGDLGELLYKTPEEAYRECLAEDYRGYWHAYHICSKCGKHPGIDRYVIENSDNCPYFSRCDGSKYLMSPIQNSWCEYFKDCMLVPESMRSDFIPKTARYADAVSRFENVSVLDSNYEVDSIKIHKKTVDIDNDGV